MTASNIEQNSTENENKQASQADKYNSTQSAFEASREALHAFSVKHPRINKALAQGNGGTQQHRYLGLYTKQGQPLERGAAFFLVNKSKEKIRR